MKNLMFVCSLAALGVQAREVKVSEFGFDPVNSTRFVQAALDSGAERVILDRQRTPWFVTPVLIRSNTEFIVEPETELVAKRGEFKKIRDYLFTLDGVSNIVIRGGAGSAFRMWKCDYQKPPYEKSEWRYALRIVRSQNVLVENMRFVESGGDGIVIGGNSKGVTIRRCVCDRNHRQGISLCAGENVLIEDTVLSNTEGTAPQDGIDMEPDSPNEFLVNCTLRNVVSYGNSGAGFDIYLNNLNSTSRPVSIRMENCRSIGNSYSFLNPCGPHKTENFVRGSIVMENCLFENPKRAVMNIGTKPLDSYLLEFRNCTVTNTAEAKTDIMLGSGLMRCLTFDGVRFDNLKIFHTKGKNWAEVNHRLNFSKPEAFGGEVMVEDDRGGIEKVRIDEAWLAANIQSLKFDPPLAERGKLPIAANAKVVDRRPGEMIRFPEYTFVNGVKLMFYMAKPGDAIFTGRQVIKAVGRPESKDKYTIHRVSDDGKKKVLAMRLNPFGTTNSEISVHLAKPGFYRLTIPSCGSRFRLESANVPVAIDMSEEQQTLGQEGNKPIELWLSGEGGDVVAAGTEYYRYKTELFAADGTPIVNLCKGDNAFVARERGGMSKMCFSMTKPHYDWITFDYFSASPFAFLSPDRHWTPGPGGETARSIALEGEYPGHLQDFWMGNDKIWWAHTQWLVKTDMNGKILTKAEVGGHHAGLEIRDGKLYAAVCNYNGEPRGRTDESCHVMVGEYDAETLEQVKMHVLDINDRAGSLCFMEDGTMLVGCLRHPALKPNEVKFHHIDRDYRLIKTHVVDVGQDVRLGIEVIRRYGNDVFLFIYGGPVVKLSADTLETKGRYESFGGQLGFAKQGDEAWVGENIPVRQHGKREKVHHSRIVCKKCRWIAVP